MSGVQYQFTCGAITLPVIRERGYWYSPQSGDYLKELFSPEANAAITVYSKYKRKLGLKHVDLMQLRSALLDFSAQRKSQGKIVHLDLLIQHASQLISTSRKTKMVDK